MNAFRRHLVVTYAVFTAFMVVLCVWAFYYTKVGAHIEDKLFDLRTEMKPDVLPVEGILRLSIDETTLKKFEEEAGDKPRLETLKTILQSLSETQASSINLIISEDIHDLSDVEVFTLVQYLTRDPRVRLGVMDVDSDVPSSRELPEPLRTMDERVFGVDAFKLRTTDIVRIIPTVGFRGREKRVLMPAAIAGKKVNEFSENDVLRINYLRPERLHRADAFDFVASELGKRKELADNNHIIFAYGQIDNRSRNGRYSYVNSPWDDERESLLNGVYIADFIAVCTLNFLHDRVLRQGPEWIVVAQSIILIVFFLFVWTFESAIAAALILIGWFGLLYLHGVLFSYHNVFVEFGSTALFATLAGFVGGQWRLRRETRFRLNKEAETSAQKDFIVAQSRFLDQFGSGLSAINENIHGYCLQLSAVPQNSPKEKSVILKLKTSCEELRDYLFSIRQFSSVTEEDERFVEKQTFELTPMVHRVVSQFDSKCEDRSIRIHINCAETFEVFSDETILEHIIFNLISNAVKYTPEGGRVEINARATKKGDVVISVTDNGIGIPEEYQKPIFEKFYRIQDGQAIEAKGHGLGLYLCRYFVEKLGGHIGLYSQIGQGSTFFITLRRGAV